MTADTADIRPDGPEDVADAALHVGLVGSLALAMFAWGYVSAQTASSGLVLDIGPPAWVGIGLYSSMTVAAGALAAQTYFNHNE